MPEDARERLKYFPIGCYIDCNTTDTMEAGICLDRLTRLFEDRVWTDRRVKQAAADHFAGENGMIKDRDGMDISKEEFVEQLEVTFISLYRDGSTVFSVDHGCELDLDGEIHMIYDDRDQVTFQMDEEFYGS